MQNTKIVNSIEVGEAVLYEGIKYIVVNIDKEGIIYSIKLESLSYPKRISCALWHSDSIAVCSPLKTTYHKILEKHTLDSFSVENSEKSWPIGEQYNKCVLGLINGISLYLPIHRCFDEDVVGIIF